MPVYTDRDLHPTAVVHLITELTIVDVAQQSTDGTGGVVLDMIHIGLDDCPAVMLTCLH